MNNPQNNNSGVLDYRKFGRLAYVHCGKRLPLLVLNTRAGWYIGTASDEEGPCSRESQEYYPSFEEAQAALDQDTWTQKQTP
jgi:hypothetical protein